MGAAPIAQRFARFLDKTSASVTVSWHFEAELLGLAHVSLQLLAHKRPYANIDVQVCLNIEKCFLS